MVVACHYGLWTVPDFKSRISKAFDRPDVAVNLPLGDRERAPRKLANDQ